MREKKKKKSPVRKFDLAWKSIIKELFEDFFEFFFPEIHKAIDFTRKPEFIDKELNEFIPGSPQGNRTSDILVKVYLKDENIKFICIVIHIEVQGQPVKSFMDRMFIYYYRTFDKEKKEQIPVISLAILTDDNDWFRPQPYNFSLFGFELMMKVPYVKLIDFKQKKELIEKMETSKNPMVMVVNALLKSHELEGANEERKFEATKALIRQCYKAGYKRDTIYLMLMIFQMVLQVPEYLKKKLKEAIITIEEEFFMNFVPLWLKDDVRNGERRGERKGRKEGKIEGKIVGKMEGKLEGKKEMAMKMLADNLPIEMITKYTDLSETQINELKGSTH